MLKPLPFLRPFYLDDVGAPLTGGKLFTWDNNTQNDKPTWQDPLGAALNTNPIILNGGGRFDCFLEPGLYTMRLEDSLGALIWERDDVTGSDASDIAVVNSIADMQALPTGTLTQVLVLGYNTPGDGGGGTFIFDPAISIPTDFGVTFEPNPTIANGRWVRMVKDEISIRYFGAVGDGVTDDKIAIENAIAYCVAPGHSRTMFAPTSPTTPYIYRMVTNPTGLNGSLGQFSFRVDDGAQLKFEVVPTINCDFQAGSYRILASTSLDPLFDPKCTFRAGPYPEWWGAINDNTLDQLIPINAWLNCGATLLFASSGTYKVSVAPITPVAVTIVMGGLVTSGAMDFIKRGIRIYGGGAVIQFAEALGGDITADAIACDSLDAGADITAGTAGPGVLRQRLGASVTTAKAISAIKNITDIAAFGSGTYKTDSNTATALMTHVIEGDTLVADGDAIRIRAAGKFSPDADTYTIKFDFQGLGGDAGGFALCPAAAPGGAPVGWFLDATFIKNGTKYLASGILIVGAGGFIPVAGYATFQASQTLSNATADSNVFPAGAFDFTVDNTIRVMAKTASGTAARYIQQNMMMIEYIPNN